MKKIAMLGALLAGLQSFAVSEAFAGNEVHLLYTGYVAPIPGHELIPGVDEENGARYLASTIGLVKGEDVIVVSDPGFLPEEIENEEGKSSPSWKAIRKAMKKLGVREKDVTHVFISHHHPDHTFHLSQFPNAKVVDFWGIYKHDLWEDHPDEYQIADGIKVIRTPGHTDEDASLFVETDDNSYLFTHLWWFNTENGPFPVEDPIGDSQADLEASRKKVICDVDPDVIVPGHGSPFGNTFDEDEFCDDDGYGNHVEIIGSPFS